MDLPKGGERFLAGRILSRPSVGHPPQNGVARKFQDARLVAMTPQTLPLTLKASRAPFASLDRWIWSRRAKAGKTSAFGSDRHPLTRKNQ
jgi:hypothetical protein